MTLALVLLIVEVLAPAARRLLKRWWVADEDRHARRPWTGSGRPPDGD